MITRGVWAALGVAFCAVGATGAWAAPSAGQQRKDCFVSLDFGISIKGCSAVIDSSQQTSDHKVAALIQRGKTYLYKGNQFELAIQDYDKAIRLDPRNAEAFLRRGKAYESALPQQFAQALRDYSESIRLRPSYTEAFRQRAEVYYVTHHYDLAIRDYSEVIRRDPDNYEAFLNRGLSHSKSNDDIDAIRDFIKPFNWTPTIPSNLTAGPVPMHRCMSTPRDPGLRRGDPT